MERNDDKNGVNMEFNKLSEWLSGLNEGSNILAVHGFLSGVFCQPDSKIRKEWKLYLPGIQQNSDIPEVIDDYLETFARGIQQDLENGMCSPATICSATETDVKDGSRIWSKAFIAGGHLQGDGFLAVQDQTVQELTFPIVLQSIADSNREMLETMAPDFDIDEVRSSALEEIGPSLKELQKHLKTQ